MRKFMINVNGTSYEVEVEEMSNAPATAKEAAPAAPKQQTAPAASQQTPAAQAPKTQAPKTQAPAGGMTITAPMPGTIKRIAVKEGASVKKNDVLFILEAMKLENEIFAPCDGVVTSMRAVEAGSVNSGDVLCVIG